MEVKRNPMTPVISDITHILNENPSTRTYALRPREELISTPRPGNFLMLWVPLPADGDPTSSALDQIPMSFSDWDGESVYVTVKDVGPTTRELGRYGVGDRVGVMGPLGNTFDLSGMESILLIGGGFGLAPLLFLAKTAKAAGIRVRSIIGAKTADELLLVGGMEDASDELVITTDDGTCGLQCFATDPVGRICNEENIDGIFTCGPEVMMKCILDLSLEIGISAQFSLERHMSCGVGVCGTCSVDGLLVCRDGPVFTSEQLKDMDDFGKPCKGPDGRVRH